jgi:hypothetical protein
VAAGVGLDGSVVDLVAALLRVGQHDGEGVSFGVLNVGLDCVAGVGCAYAHVGDDRAGADVVTLVGDDGAPSKAERLRELDNCSNQGHSSGSPNRRRVISDLAAGEPAAGVCLSDQASLGQV